MAVGETLRRLACKLALTLISGDIQNVFLPQQLGVGTPNGSEAIIHSVATILENLHDDNFILQVDFSNAFNLVSRTKFIELTHKFLPPIWNIVNYLYSGQSLLRIGNSDETILSCAGVQQGCPLAPILFGLALRELTTTIATEVPELALNSWYLDDGHLSGKAPDLMKCLAIIETAGSDLGLKLNLAKCIVYGSNPSLFPTEISRASDGLVVLGAPIGTATFVKDHVRRIIDNASTNIFKSRDINDPQMELLLLRCSSGSPKLNYWQRSCIPDMIQEELADFDRSIDRGLQHILGTPIFGQNRLTCHLPLSMGGLGIPIASISSDAAFVASVGASWTLQPSSEVRHGFQDARLRLLGKNASVPDLPTKFSNELPPLFKPLKEFSQRKFMLAINGTIRSDIGSTSNIKKEIIMKGRSCKGANYWLTSPPNPRFNTKIEGAAFRLLLKYSIGLPLLRGSHKCPDCGKDQDNYGHHALSCKVASGAIDKHNSIVNGIFGLLKKAHITCSSEAFNPMKDNQERPGDIYMPEFDVYGDAFFDLSVISICADSYFARAAKGQLEGSKIRYDLKMKKYPDLGSRFKPLIIESTGGWHPFSFDYLKTLADHIAAKTNVISKDALNTLLTTSAFRLQRHQGTMLVRRCLGL
jgi:Reverse transcriptase (RNA-dependent DNA polymerase)